MDSYLYDLYYSSNPDDIVDFYTNFNTAHDIISWLKKMPKEKEREIIEIEGDKDIVVTMSTINAQSKHAKEAVELYKGQQIIFVQNADKLPQKYFNISKSYNMGLIQALKYKPKYVILSNDDMIKVDDFSKLKKQIEKIDSKYDTLFTDTLYTPPYNVSHSMPMDISSMTGFYKLYNRMKGGYSAKTQAIMDKFDLSVICNSNTERKMLHAMLFRKIISFYNIGNFAIFGPKFLKSKGREIFDELCFNGYDDIDVSLALNKRNNYSMVDFKINALQGTSFGMSPTRWLRALASHIYFDYKWKKGMKAPS